MPSLYANKFVRFERMIWPCVEFKKSFLTATRKKTFWRIFRSFRPTGWCFESYFSPRVHLEKQQLKHGDNLRGFIHDSGFPETLHSSGISSCKNFRDLKHQDGRGGRRLTGSEKSHFDSSALANRLHHPVLPSSSTWSEEFWRRAQNVSKFWLFLSWNVTVGSKYLM